MNNATENSLRVSAPRARPTMSIAMTGMRPMRVVLIDRMSTRFSAVFMMSV